ncbi:leucyl aminopeptidase family protein [Lacibacterium aquatile]|uniref:Leucyl aminopeptidase family protein n=1 Tax=Lacibacterium aquatile TaxID=1168082 RepID=A0ABW5DTS3_9PROT
MELALLTAADKAAQLHLVTKSGLSSLDPAWKAHADLAGFTGDAGTVLALPGGGFLAGVAEGDTSEALVFALGGLPDALPAGDYRLAVEPDSDAASAYALSWALGAYGFTRYKKRKKEAARLLWPAKADQKRVTAIAEAIHQGRDLINTPAGDLGPKELAEVARGIAARFGAEFSVIVGDELLDRGYPAVHAVGRAAANAPRLIDIRWGNPDHKKITLVGKGVCFDSGGLDIKPASGMINMKKDMGGGAAVLTLGQIIMALGLPVRLRVLVPAVENAISGNAFRPWDVLQTRKGLTVEVGNTDAEGRLILCDALAEGDSEKPDLMINCATLTGAARVALGTELPALFTRHDDLAEKILAAGTKVADPLWRLPLWPGYRRQMDSKVADLSSTGEGAFGGAINAAIYLAEFVEPTTRWAHIDMYGWNARTRPGRPEGGEVMVVRALLAMIEGEVA